MYDTFAHIAPALLSSRRIEYVIDCLSRLCQNLFKLMYHRCWVNQIEYELDMLGAWIIWLLLFFLPILRIMKKLSIASTKKFIGIAGKNEKVSYYMHLTVHTSPIYSRLIPSKIKSFVCDGCVCVCVVWDEVLTLIVIATTVRDRSRCNLFNYSHYKTLLSVCMKMSINNLNCQFQLEWLVFRNIIGVWNWG